MAKYSIWWLEGDMSRKERSRAQKPLRNAFRDAFYYVADDHEFLKKHYRLEYRERITEQFFVLRWMESQTAGIFFVGHAHRGCPSLYHPSIDGHGAEPRSEDWPVLDPKRLKGDLTGANKNLYLLAFISCYSKNLRKQWEALAPSHTFFQGFPNTVAGLSWLNRRDRHGAAQMFRSLLLRGPAGPEPKPKSIFNFSCQIASAEATRGPSGLAANPTAEDPMGPGPSGLT